MASLLLLFRLPSYFAHRKEEVSGLVCLRRFLAVQMAEKISFNQFCFDLAKFAEGRQVSGQYFSLQHCWFCMYQSSPLNKKEEGLVYSGVQDLPPNLLLLVYVCVSVCAYGCERETGGGTCAMDSMWKSEDNFVELVLPFYLDFHGLN